VRERAGRRFGGEAVGVVGDVRRYALTRGLSAHICTPFAQFPLSDFDVVERSGRSAIGPW
jgi:hypothetical protein